MKIDPQPWAESGDGLELEEFPLLRSHMMSLSVAETLRPFS